MNQEQLKIRNDLLAQISALKASISGLELTGNDDYKDLIDGNKEALKVVEQEFQKFEKEMEELKRQEVIAKQKASQKLIEDEFKFISKYLAHCSKVKIDERPDDDMLGRMKIIKRKHHVVRRLKMLGL